MGGPLVYLGGCMRNIRARTSISACGCSAEFGFTCVALLALTLGSAANRYLQRRVRHTLAPLPYPTGPTRFVWSKVNGNRNGVSAGTFGLEAQSTVFQTFARGPAAIYSLSTSDHPE